MKNPIDIDQMVAAYIECALWSSTGDDDHPLDDDYSASDINEETRKEMGRDCVSFLNSIASENIENYVESVNNPSEQMGHDFWLTRNGHGAGFWDRGLGGLGEVLTEQAHACGSYDLYVGDDGEVYGQ